MQEYLRNPPYQDVDGYRASCDFSPDAVRGVMKYKPKIGDFFIVSFPKCGTTWTQQIVSLIFDKGVSVSNYKEFNERTPFLEMCGVEAIDLMKKPGALKIHTPFCFTPYSPDAKYLYVVRNPKDTVISLHHHVRNFYRKLKDLSFETFFEIFINGETNFGDYFDHVLSWYEHKDDPNVMFLLYEEIKRDTQNTVKKIARFIGDDYASMLENDPEVLNNILTFSSIEHMKNIDNVVETLSNVDFSEKELQEMPPGLRYLNELKSKEKPLPGQKFQLVRSGKVGDWRTTLTDDQNRRMDEKIVKKLKGTKLYDFWKELNCI